MFLQYVIAWALARAHSHLWATNEAAQMIRDSGGYFPPEKFKQTCEQNPDLPQGLDMPWADDDGVIRHVTGTGRLAWMIDRKGNTVVEVHRPLIGIVASGLFVGETESYEVKPCCFVRHLEAFTYAARAVVWAQSELLEAAAIADADMIDEPASVGDED